MNTGKSPQWSCRFVRGWASWLGARDRGMSARHIAGCPACREFFAATDALDAGLRRDAGRVSQAPSSDLEERIMREIVRPLAQTERRPARRGWALAGAGVAAAIMFMSAFFRARHNVTPPSGTVAVHAPRPTLTAPTAIANGTLTLPANVSTLLAQDPLQGEVKSVYADAQSAVRFLALNFLPSGNGSRNGVGRKASAGG